jgi:hypothetical protein
MKKEEKEWRLKKKMRNEERGGRGNKTTQADHWNIEKLNDWENKIKNEQINLITEQMKLREWKRKK